MGKKIMLRSLRKFTLKDLFVQLGIKGCSLDNYFTFLKFMILQAMFENLLGTAIFVQHSSYPVP